jgi:RNA polymerase sigma-70 factor (ECF subfamily)
MSGMTEPPDRELLSACRAGDPEAFGVFYVRHRQRILAYLARRVRQPEVAADLMAETFAAALVATRDRDAPVASAPLAWLFTIARNTLIDSRRRGRVEAEARKRLGLSPLVLDDQDLERVIEIAEATDILAGLPETLSAEEWEAVRRRVLDEEAYADIAGSLRCSEAVARKRVSRALAQLRTAIGAVHA